MRRFALIGIALCFAVPIARADDPIADARRRWLRGNLAEARELYQRLSAKPEHAVVAALGLSRVAEDDGDLDAANQAIDAALRAAPRNSELLSRLAELHYRRGRLDEAIKSADAAIALQPNQFLARWIRANVKLDRGDLDGADAEFRWFVRTYTARDRAGDPIRDPETLLLVARAGAINARWHNLNDQFRFILIEVLGDALKDDPDFWPAECFAGQLLLEKYNRGEALAAFDKALAINPRAALALVGKGRLALQQFEIAEAERSARQALSANPKSVEALHLAADVHLACGELADAEARLGDALSINPIQEETLGRLAACRFVAQRTPEYEALVAEVTRRDPKPGRFWLALASRLDDRRLYDDAERAYRRAIEAWPRLGDAKTGLGLLALRLGQEDEAKKALTAAFQADPFNVRVANSLKVLRHLDGYATLRTPHFILRYDEKADGLLAHYMADVLEAEHENLAKQFRFAPPGPILVEVFNRHDMFSGRTIGLPDLHTIGATTGRMFAMVSPKGQGVPKAFNWGRVVRHELVHVFNLEQTRFQVPHWLTEGLAVRNEGQPRPAEWIQLLAERAGTGTLFDLSTVHVGFMRPKNPVDWTLAYCQAHLYVEYLVQAHGEDVIARLLAAYRDGLGTAAALEKAGAGDIRSVEAGYRRHVRAVVTEARGRPPEKPLSLAQLQAAVEATPDDLDLAARLAEQYWSRRRAAEARELADRVLQKQPKQGLALVVKAQLLLSAGEDEHAVQLLELAAALDPPQPKALRALGRWYFDAGKLDAAEAAYRRGRIAEPNDPAWLEELARVYKQTGQVQERIAVLEALAAADADDLPIRRELAERHASAQRWADAERWARAALEIDVGDRSAQTALLQALDGLGRSRDAERYRRLFRGTPSESTGG